MSQDFFYDGQIRRYLVQFIRIFSHLSHQTGPDKDGVITEKRIPVMYGDPSWQAANIIRQGSQNTLMPVPLMSAWILGLELAPKRRNDPAFEGVAQGIERKFEDNQYTTEPGNRFTVNRYMPVPYTLTMQLDIWTSNTDTKLQIIEQIMTIFNPSIQLQQTSNIFDWTSVFEVELKSIKWTNRSMPASTEDRDVASLTFEMGIWISAPAKLKRQVLIEQIITDIHGVASVPDADHIRMFENPANCVGNRISRIIVTPGNYGVSIGYHEGYANNELVLLSSSNLINTQLNWHDLLKVYGKIDENTKIRIKTEDDLDSTEGDILGSIVVDEDRPNVAVFTIDTDTLPSDTIRPFLQVIDPTEVWPGNGLPAAVEGQRYLITSWLSAGEEPATPENTVPWGNLVAWPNDIISYAGGVWGVSFNSREESTAVTTNINNNSKYRFVDGEWQSLYYGIYEAGYWRVEDLLEANDDPENFGMC